MAYLSNNVFDNGLNHIDTNTEKLYILSANPGSTWGNIATYALGNKATPAIAAPTDRAAGGREIVIAAITDGVATKTGAATHYALTDDSASEILASSTLSSTLSVTSGGTFGLESFTIGIPDPA